MGLYFQPMDEAAAQQVVAWRYPAPYDIYNFDLAVDQIEPQVRFLLEPANGYFRIDDDSHELIAFCCFGADARVPGGDYSRPTLDIGLGVRPDLTGKGRAQYYVGAVIAFAAERFKPPRLRVTIAAFNERAQHAWERAGFRQVQAFDHSLSGRRFVILDGEP